MLLKKKKVIIYGTEMYSIKTAYKLTKEGKYEIEYFIDSKLPGGDLPHEVQKRPIYTLEEAPDSKSLIVVTGPQHIYERVRKTLIDLGKRENKDFIWSEILDKKVAVLHGNCHMDTLKMILNDSKEFCEDYVLYDIPLIQNLKNGEIPEYVLEMCDLFIHEDIREENKFGEKSSDEYIRTKLKSSCKDVVVPHLFGLGKIYFPGFEYNKRQDKVPAQMRGGAFSNSDKVFQDMAIAHCSEKEIYTKLFETDRPYSDEEIQENFDYYINYIRERENAWDIKILDYILENYKEKKVFYDAGHPSKEVMEEIGRRLLEYLGYPGWNPSGEKPIKVLDLYEVPVYPCVKEVLGCTFDDSVIRKSQWGINFSDKPMDSKEYIKQYLFWSTRI